MNARRILHEAGAAGNPAFPPGNLGKRQSRRRSPMRHLPRSHGAGGPFVERLKRTGQHQAANM